MWLGNIWVDGRQFHFDKKFYEFVSSSLEEC